MNRYASGTSVSPEKSRGEIERLLMRFGASQFGYMTTGDRVMIGFVHNNLPVQLSVPLPSKKEDRFRLSPSGRRTRTQEQAFDAWDAEVRRRWRSLCAVVKALLVGVEDGVLDFEQAFMAHIVWGDGRTTYQHVLPTITKALEGGGMPSSMKGLPLLTEK